MTIKPHDNLNGKANSSVQKPTEVPPIPTSTVSATACPFIGLEDDPSTRLMFTSPAAYCHRADPICAVDLNHQQEYCLTSVHKLCPVFMKPEWGPLPSELEYHEPESSNSNKRWFWFIAIILVLGLIAGSAFLWSSNGSNSTIEAEPNGNSPAIIAASTSTPTSTRLATKTTAPTATLMPSSTDTKQPTKTNTPPATSTPQPTATLVPTYTSIPPTFTSIPPTETAVPVIQALVAVPFLNIRSGPGTDYELLETIAQDEQIELTGRVSDSSWWQICCVNGGPGWVIGEAIEIPPEADELVPFVNGIPPLPTPTNES